MPYPYASTSSVSSGSLVKKRLFGATVITAAAMPSVPEPTEPAAVALSLFAAVSLTLWFLTLTHRGSISGWTSGRWVFIFIGLVLVSSLTALSYGTPIDLWFRGAIPFLFLLLFFPAADIARKDPHWLLNAVHLSAVVWLVITGTQALGAVPAVFSGEVQRITHATEAWAAFQLPYAMVGLALTLFHPPNWSKSIRWLLAFAFTLLPILAVSRGQMVVVFTIWLTYVILLPPSTRSRAVAILVFVMIAGSIYTAQIPLGESIVGRFSQAIDSDESSRAAELKYAIGRFLESPLLGMGLGHQIPTDVTFLGDWETIVKAGVSSVGYMHNVAGYLLMTLGLPGLLSYGAFILSALPRGVRQRSDVQKKLLTAAVLSLLALCAWNLMQASFRLIQANLLLAVIIAVLSVTRQYLRVRVSA